MSRPRVLIIAEEANPEWVSVPLEGWSHSEALRNVADVHVVTQIRNRDAFKRIGLVEGQDFTAIDSEAIAKPMWIASTILRGDSGKSWTTSTAMKSLSYPYFEHLVWQKFGRELHRGKFDIVHRLTPLSPTAPSLLAHQCKKIGVPFVLGPLNGGVPWPAGFDNARRQEREWMSYVRSAFKLVPGYSATRRLSSAIIIGSRDTYAQMPKCYYHKCVYIAENAIDPKRFSISNRQQSKQLLRLAFVGRLVPYKGADMLLEAAGPFLRNNTLTLDIIGDGPMADQLHDYIRRNGIKKQATMHGWVKHDNLHEHLKQCNVFAFPSIREFGGAVVLEAMAIGLVPIVVDYGGPSELVTNGTGFKIPLGSRNEIVSRLRSLLESLSSDPSPLSAMSKRAKQRVQTWFTWSAKANQTLEVYRWVLGERIDKPQFGMPYPDK